MPWGQKKLTMHEQRFLPSGLLFQHCLEGPTTAGRRKINKRWRTERNGQTVYRDWIPVYLHHFYFLLPAQSSAHCSQASCYPALKTSLIKDTRLPNLNRWVWAVSSPPVLWAPWSRLCLLRLLCLSPFHWLSSTGRIQSFDFKGHFS